MNTTVDHEFEIKFSSYVANRDFLLSNNYVITWCIHIIFQCEYLDDCLFGIILNDVGNRNCFMVCTNTHSVSRRGFDIAIDFKLVCKLS